MKDNLKRLRKYLELSQEAFGEKIGLKGSTISYIESGRSSLTDQTVISICREWNVSEDWLKDGTGEMFVDLSRQQQAAASVARMIKSDNPFVLSALTALGELSPEEWAVIEKFIAKLKD